MAEKKLTPEILNKAMKASSIEELEQISAGAGLDYSREDLEKFAGKLGILPTGQVSDESLGNVAGGRSTVNGQEVECTSRDMCEILCIDIDPSWGTSGSNGIMVPAARWDAAVAARLGEVRAQRVAGNSKIKKSEGTT
jgi:hypothetical protein